MLQVILSAVYFLILAPLGFVLRLWRDPMARGWDPSMPSYRILPRTHARLNLRSLL